MHGGPLDCTCNWTVPRCDACLTFSLERLKSAAWLRGERWAKEVAARTGVVLPWPAFHGLAESIARRKVVDLERHDARIATALARECHAAAGREWERLRG